MDEFFQRLREIQKKERSTSGLADVGDNFYKDVHNYLDKLIMKIGNNPFLLNHISLEMREELQQKSVKGENIK